MFLYPLCWQKNNYAFFQNYISLRNSFLRRKKIDTKEFNSLALAFLGDAVHTLYVREFALNNPATLKNYNAICSHFCSAVFQAKVFDKLVLEKEEEDVAKRARNAKNNNIAKNATIEQYKKATSLEAVIGWLYLKKREERLNQILKSCVEE